MARDDRRKRRQARREARRSNQKTAEDFRRQERENELKGSGFSSMEEMDAANAQKEKEAIERAKQKNPLTRKYKTEKTGSQTVPNSMLFNEKYRGKEIPEYRTSSKGLTVISQDPKSPEEMDAIRRSQAESQAIQNIANNDGTGTQTNVVTAVTNSGDRKENTLSNLEKAKEIGEGAKEQENKNSAAQINNEDLGIALKGDEIKATPGASDFTKGFISTTQKPTYDPNAQQVQQDIAKQQKAQTPLAIEKLALQDYFPNAGRNIAVGTFTGSRIGSQTIYSGYGALAPMGLIDARKRAVAEKAKAKRAKLDQFLSIPDTYKVYHDFAKPYAAGKFAEIAAKHGWDYDKIMSDPEALKEVYRMKGVYETFEKAGTAAEELKELMQDPTKEVYISPKIRKKIWAFTRGQVNPEPYLSGKRDINEITKGMVPYPSFIKFFNDNSSKWFAEGRQGEMPISFKDYGPLTPEKLNEMKDGIDKFRINQDNDAYVELVKKHFAIDDNLVKTWAKTNGIPLDDEIIEVWEDFFINMIPPDIIEREITHVSNKAADRALGWARLNQEKMQTLSFHNRIAEEIKKNGVYKDGANKDMTPLERRYNQSYSLQNAGFTNISTDANGAYASVPVPTDESPLYTPKENSSMLQITQDGVQKIVSASTILNHPNSYTEDQVTAATQLRNGDLISQPDELIYRYGTTDASGATHLGDDAHNGNLNHSIYSAQSGLAGYTIEKIDPVSKMPVKEFVPYKGVRAFTNLGNLTKEGAQFSSDNILNSSGKESSYRAAGQYPINR